MSTRFRAAPQVADIADRLIVDHHPHLINVRIEYIFRDKASSSKGRIVLGKARKIAGLNAFLASDVPADVVPEPDQDFSFFVVEIAHDWWETMSLEGRRALVDHELCHLYVDPDSGALSIHGHDLEEFGAIVRRHGMWRPDVESFADAIQPSLLEREEQTSEEPR